MEFGLRHACSIETNNNKINTSIAFEKQKEIPIISVALNIKQNKGKYVLGKHK